MLRETTLSHNMHRHRFSTYHDIMTLVHRKLFYTGKEEKCTRLPS